MGRMVLMFPLEDGVDEDDLKVEMSCWQLKVSKSGPRMKLAVACFANQHVELKMAGV